jgi:hypothetical protein
VTLGKQNAFGSVPVCNGSENENIGSLCGWLTILPTMKCGEKIDQMVKFKGPTRVEDIGG